MLAESVYKGVLHIGNFREFLHLAGGFLTFKTGIPGGPGVSSLRPLKIGLSKFSAPNSCEADSKSATTPLRLDYRKV